METVEYKDTAIEIPIEHESSFSEPPQPPEAASLETSEPIEDAGDEAAPPEERTPDPLQESEDRFRRLAADFANYKRRVESERGELLDVLEARLLNGIMSIYDDFCRLSENSIAADEQLAQGIKAVQAKWQAWLVNENVERIKPAGEPFDPHLHHAVMQQTVTDAAQDGKILQVIEPGYKRREKVLRHAKVIVGHYEEAEIVQDEQDPQAVDETAPAELEEARTHEQ